jgi:hypothetical protein
VFCQFFSLTPILYTAKDTFPKFLYSIISERLPPTNIFSPLLETQNMKKQNGVAVRVSQYISEHLSVHPFSVYICDNWCDYGEGIKFVAISFCLLT